MPVEHAHDRRGSIGREELLEDRWIAALDMRPNPITILVLERLISIRPIVRSSSCCAATRGIFTTPGDPDAPAWIRVRDGALAEELRVEAGSKT